MWLASDIIAAVDRVARIHYVAVADTTLWNANRRDGELRLLTGWQWTARDGTAYRQGFKTATVCYRDAWYALITRTDAPVNARPRLRVVPANKARVA